jgi:hypothetical protein
VFTEIHTNKQYIGSTINFNTRLNNHLRLKDGSLRKLAIELEIIILLLLRLATTCAGLLTVLFTNCLTKLFSGMLIWIRLAKEIALLMFELIHNGTSPVRGRLM